MAKDSTKRLLLFKIETTEGVDAGPTVGVNALVTVGMDATGLNGDTRVRNVDGAYFGARPQAVINVTRPITFGVEIAGSGTDVAANTAWGPLLRICGFDGGAAIPAGSPTPTGVQHRLISDLIPSATLYPFIDNLRLPGLGTRGSFTITFEDDEIPLFNFTLTGYPPSDFLSEAVPGTPIYMNQAAPLLATSQNTFFMLDAYSPALRRLTIDIGGIITPRSLIGPADRVRMTNREITFEALIEFPDMTAKNYFQSINGALVPMSIVHGTSPKNIVRIASDRAQILLPSFSDEDGTLMQTIRGRLIPSAAGNDELFIVTQ